eukprot:432337_1
MDDTKSEQEGLISNKNESNEKQNISYTSCTIDVTDAKSAINNGVVSVGKTDKWIQIKDQPCISINTACKCLEYFCLIWLNVLVSVWYDTNTFERSDIFWVIFVFAYVSNIDGIITHMIALILFEIAQYVLYLWFCSFSSDSLLVFSLLLFVSLCSKLIRKLVYKFGADIETYLIHQHIHQQTKEYKFYGPAKWYNCREIAMLMTTVPMFYFNQNRVWGHNWFAILVVIVLWYHRIMDIISLIHRDNYTRKWMKDIQNESNKFDQKRFEIELRRPIKEYEYQEIMENIIPIGYHLILLLMLIVYFIKWEFGSQLSAFESIYAKKSKGKLTLQQILDEGKQDPQLSDLFGVWTIDTDKHCCETFTLKEENVIEVDTDEMHKLAETDQGCCSHGVNDIYNSCVVGAVQLPLSESRRRNELKTRPPLWFNSIQPQGYKFILHRNGIIKFVPIGDSLTHQLALARLDSKGCFDLLKNIKHANKYSCFCLGILSKKGEIKRYNRWNTDLDYFYTARKAI